MVNERLQDSEKPSPYLSIVVTSRNDDHGRNMLHRMEAFIHGLAHQCRKFRLDTELIVVEWNPIQGKKRLYEAAALPQNNAYLDIRFIEVPGHIHNRIENADKIPLYQMTAKNVGIRRARGEFVLAAAIDLLFSDELMWMLSKRVLDPACFYRVARYDVGKTKIPMDVTFEDRIQFCKQNLARIHTPTKTIDVDRKAASPTTDHQGFFTQSVEDLKAVVSRYQNDKLFTNACGDFTLMAREKWFDLRGYPEISKWSIFIDGLLLHMAHVSGLHQVILEEPMRIYHIEHDTGWAVDRETVKERPSLDYEKDYLPWCRQMLRERKVINPNGTQWGYAQIEFIEWSPADTEEKTHGAPTVSPDSKQDDSRRTAGYGSWIERIASAEKNLYYRDQTAETLQQLVNIARRHKPTRIVEIGTLSGMSLRAWISAELDADITAIDLSFKALEESKRILPLELNRVTLIAQDVLEVAFDRLWEEHDRVLLFVDAHDQPSVPIMRHLIDTAFEKLPAGSMVIVDDLWFSPARLDHANAESWFHASILKQIDELQCFEGYYAPYWSGGSFFGFYEVLPLMSYVNRHKIKLSHTTVGKAVWFEVPPSGLPGSDGNGAGRDDGPTGKVAYHPLAWIGPQDRPNDDGGALGRTCRKAVDHYAEGDLETAFQCLAKAIELDRGFAAAYYGLAVIMARSGEWTSALNLLQQERVANCRIDAIEKLRSDIRKRLNLPSPNIAMTAPISPAAGHVTIFTVPKAFHGHIDMIQRNAIKSWTLLEPRPEILLLGDEAGVDEAAREFGAIHIPDIAVNEYGTPLLDSIFAVAESNTANTTMAYINADIILLSDFMTSVGLLVDEGDKGFFGVGKRWDLEIKQAIEFNNGHWDRDLMRLIGERGDLHASTGIDYFLFKKGTLAGLKPFALGRTVWDNWMIKNALDLGLPVVDASQMITAIHQNHDYQHLKGGAAEAWNGIEAKKNLLLAGGYDQMRDISFADWALTPRGRRPKMATSPKGKFSPPESTPVVDQPKFSVVMIVLNGMPFIDCSLSSIYDIAHEIVIVEGAVEKCMFSANPDGSSIDGTVEFIKAFPDPHNKIKLIQGRWPEKCEMQNKALEYVTGDYVWLVDSDEVYREDDLIRIRKMVADDPAISQINFICHNFWKDFDHIIVSNKLFAPAFHFRRIFKFQPGARFISHRPPTMVHPDTEKTTEQMHCVDGMSLWRRGIAIYHYSYVLDNQVKQKMELYRRYGWDKTWEIDMQCWYNDFYKRWTPDRRLELESGYPVWTGDKASYSIPFKGTHPRTIAHFQKNNPASGKPSDRPFAMRHIVEAVEELLYQNLPGPPLVVLETGTIRSYDEKHESTLHLSRALGRGGKLTSVDISPESIRISRDICKNADNVEWVLSDSLSYLTKNCPEKMHFVLLDSVNDPETIFSEFSLVAPHMAPNGVVIVDDAGIRKDGTGYDRSPAKKGHRIWQFLTESGADFEILETVPGHSTQIKVRFTEQNAQRILSRIVSWSAEKPTQPAEKSSEPQRMKHAVEGSNAKRSNTEKPVSPDLHIVIDGVIFQLQAGRPHGISRVWRNLIQQIKRKMPRSRITLLQREGFPLPVSGDAFHTIPAYRLGNEEVLDADDEMLRRVCRDLKADLFLSTYYTRAPGVVNTVMIHDMIPELFGYDLSQPEWLAKQRVIETGDAFMCVSHATQHDLTRCYPHTATSPVAVVQNGLDACFKPADPAEILALRKKLGLTRDYVLLVGNRQGYKGGQALLKALAQKPSNSDFTVLCVGGERRPSDQEVKAKGELDVRFAGRLTDSELAAAYSGAQALFVPSKYEGFGLPVLEAMACGCPVIAENSPAVIEVGGEAVCFSDLSCPDSVHLALKRIDEPAFREKMVSTGQIRAARFNWEKSADDLCRFVMAVTNKPSILLTAIVSTYNASRFIRGCLEDLESQTIADRLEIIVVDSASQEDEAAVVRDFQRRYANIKYIRTANREKVYRAWNRGIKFALGKYVTNANTDDRHRHDAYELMVGALEDNEDVALVYADVIKTQTANETFRQCTPTGMYHWYDWDRDTLLEKGCFIGPQPVWRKEVHRYYGYFDENYEVSADFEFWLRISQTNEFHHISKPLGLYMDRPDSVEHANASKKKQEDRQIITRYRRAAREQKRIGFLPDNGKNSVRNDRTPQDRLATNSHMAEPNLSIAQGGHQMTSPETIFKAIEHLIEQGQKASALWAMEKLLADYPDNARFQNEMAALAYEQADTRKALAHFKKAVALEPRNAVYLKNLADYYYVVEKDVENALAQYEGVLDVDPGNTEALIMAGHLSVSLHRYAQSRQYYQRAMALDPQNEDVRRILEKMSDPTPGQTTSSMSVDDLYAAAEDRIKSGDREAAIPLLEQLLNQDDRHAVAHNDLGVLQYECGNLQAALTHYEKAADLQPENETFQRNLADFYLAVMGDHKRAMATYVQVLKLNPLDVEAMLACAQVCLVNEQKADAVDFVNTVLELEPWNESAQTFLQQLESGPTPCGADAAGLYEGARSKASNGDLQGAIDDLTRYIKLAPEDANAHNDLGVLYFEAGEKEKAISSYETAVQLAPSDHTYCKNLADIYLVEQGQIEDAMKLYLKVLEEAPQDIESLIACGMISASVGQSEDARHFYHKALEIEPWNETALQALDAVRKVDGSHSNQGVGTAAAG